MPGGAPNAMTKTTTMPLQKRRRIVLTGGPGGDPHGGLPDPDHLGEQNLNPPGMGLWQLWREDLRTQIDRLKQRRNFGLVFEQHIPEIQRYVHLYTGQPGETQVALFCPSTFHRLGESRPRRFAGKLVAATHRELGVEMRAGRFREDLYYRLCGDIVRTPSLAERLRDSPEELALLVAHLAHTIVGPEEGPVVAAETVRWIERSLPADYPWPGNVRELGQCVRNVLLRREYHPDWQVAAGGRAGPAAELAAEVEAGDLTLQQLARRYTTLVYARSGSYLEAARRLGLDRRTVRAYVDEDLLAELRGGVRRPLPEDEEPPGAPTSAPPGAPTGPESI